MIDQPPPKRGQQVVFHEASRQINEAMNHQFKKGLAEYHTPLMTFNGRKAATDWMQEQADVLIYGTQLAMEYEHILKLLVLARDILTEVDGHLEPGDPSGIDIDCLLEDIEKCIGPSALPISDDNQPVASIPHD